MPETINGLKVEVVDYDEEKAKKNLAENDWSGKMTDGRGEG